MEKQTLGQTLEEIMDRYDEYREKWIQVNGNDEGYNKWFSTQVGITLARNDEI